MKHRYVKHGGTLCSRCLKNAPAPKTRYCLACHAAVMREWRRDHPPTKAQRRKSNARSYAGVYKRRGKLIPQPCQNCGSDKKVEMHHDDYDQPLKVEWHCRPCHVDLHHQEGLRQ